MNDCEKMLWKLASQCRSQWAEWPDCCCYFLSLKIEEDALRAGSPWEGKLVDVEEVVEDLMEEEEEEEGDWRVMVVEEAYC